VVVDIRSNCAEIKTQMDLKSAEDCPCAFPICCPVSLSCGDRTFADGRNPFRTCRYFEVTRQVSLPSSHRSRSSHQTLSRTNSFFIACTFFAVQLFAQPMRSSWSSTQPGCIWVHLFERVKSHGFERTILLRLTTEESQDGIGRDLLKELLQCGPALFSSDGVTSRGLSSCRSLFYGVRGRYVLPIAFSAGYLCANGRCLSSAARWRHWLPYGRSRVCNGRWRLHDVHSVDTGRVRRARFSCPCFRLWAAGPQC